MLEIALRQAFVVTVTTTPQLVLAARPLAQDNRSYLSMFNKGGVVVMVAPDIEYNSPNFTLGGSGREIAANGGEYWEQPGAVPMNAYYAWTLSGTAPLGIWEG